MIINGVLCDVFVIDVGILLLPARRLGLLRNVTVSGRKLPLLGSLGFEGSGLFGFFQLHFKSQCIPQKSLRLEKPFTMNSFKEAPRSTFRLRLS